MTNTKQLTGAVALLASIAVLDNFIIVELEPGFESMVLIEPYGSPIDPETTQASGSSEAMPEPKDFWIDQHLVSSTDFAEFLESTGYELQKVEPRIQQIMTNQNAGLTLAVADDKMETQAGSTSWTKTGDILPMSHTVAGQDDLQVSFKDAQRYCNWLGKVLLTAEQSKYIAKEDHDKQVSGPMEFRCVRNI